MHLASASSRALLGALAVGLAGAVAAAPPPATMPSPGGPSDATLLEAARGKFRGSVLATARATLPGSELALLVAARARKDQPVAFALLTFAVDAAGAATLVGNDEVLAAPIFGDPVVSLTAGTPAVASGALTAVVGWKAADGSASEQAVVYRSAGGRLSRLLAARPNRSYAAGGDRPSVRNEIELLPTSTSGFRDLRVRSRECPSQGECGDPTEVASYTFDGVRYVQRPYAIPFVEKIVASSALESAGALKDYSGASAIDGRPDTAWCEGASGAGWFQKLELTLQPAERLRAITILPGPAKGEPWGDWTRPKRIRLLLPEGRKLEADLADEQRPQRVEIPEGERGFELTVVIVDVYKGKREDACISELELEVEP